MARKANKLVKMEKLLAKCETRSAKVSMRVSILRKKNAKAKIKTITKTLAQVEKALSRI